MQLITQHSSHIHMELGQKKLHLSIYCNFGVLDSLSHVHYYGTLITNYLNGLNRFGCISDISWQVAWNDML